MTQIELSITREMTNVASMNIHPKNKPGASKKYFCRALLAQSIFLSNILLCFVAATLLSGCLDIKQSIVVNGDGSGSVVVKFVVEKQWAPLVVPDLQKALQKDMPAGLALTGVSSDAAGNSVVEVKGTFGNVAELNDKETQYIFVAEDGNPFRKTYRFEIRHLAAMNFDVPIPFEFLVKMPGTINETNGMKASSNEVKWTSQTGFPKGTIHSARSTATSPLGILLYGAGALAVLLAGWFFVSRRAPKGPAVARIEGDAVPVIFCTECGQKNSESAAFCTHCGQKLTTG